jgi:hypothetical protein
MIGFAFYVASPLEGEVGPQVRVGGDAAALSRSAGMLRQYPPPVDAGASPTSPSRGEAI